MAGLADGDVSVRNSVPNMMALEQNEPLQSAYRTKSIVLARSIIVRGLRSTLWV